MQLYWWKFAAKLATVLIPRIHNKFTQGKTSKDVIFVKCAWKTLKRHVLFITGMPWWVRLRDAVGARGTMWAMSAWNIPHPRCGGCLPTLPHGPNDSQTGCCHCWRVLTACLWSRSVLTQQSNNIYAILYFLTKNILYTFLYAKLNGV